MPGQHSSNGVLHGIDFLGALRASRRADLEDARASLIELIHRFMPLLKEHGIRLSSIYSVLVPLLEVLFWW